MTKDVTLTLDDIADIVVAHVIDKKLLTVSDAATHVDITWSIKGKNTTLTISEKTNHIKE